MRYAHNLYVSIGDWSLLV